LLDSFEAEVLLNLVVLFIFLVKELTSPSFPKNQDRLNSMLYFGYYFAALELVKQSRPSYQKFNYSYDYLGPYYYNCLDFRNWTIHNHYSQFSFYFAIQ
jgi:hypothetical protein